VHFELSGRLESDVSPVVASFLIAEEFAPQLLAHRFVVAYQLRQYAGLSKVAE
jgi:hypothetical protein